MSNFHANTADNHNRKSSGDVSNRFNNEPSNSLLNTTNFQFIDADINSSSDEVNELGDDAIPMPKIGYAAENEFTKIENPSYPLESQTTIKKLDSKMKIQNDSKCNDLNSDKIGIENKKNKKCDNEIVGASYNNDDVSLKIPFENENSENPYAELEIYLENVKKEINEVLQQFKLNEEIDVTDSSGLKSSKQHNKAKPKSEIGTDNAEYIETTEWANNVLKELDNIKLYDEKSQEKSKSSSGTSKNEDGLNICNIPKPKKTKKHTCIPLYSFQLDGSTRTKISNKDKNILATTDHPSQNVLKIYESSSNFEKRSISTQTSPKKYDNRNESTSTIWTSDENLLKNDENVDEE